MPRLARSLFAAATLALAVGAAACGDPNGCDQRGDLVVDDVALPDAMVGEAYDQEVPISAAGLATVALDDDATLPDGLDLVEDEGDFFVRGEATTVVDDHITPLAGTELSTQCAGRRTTFDVVLSVVEALPQ